MYVSVHDTGEVFGEVPDEHIRPLFVKVDDEAIEELFLLVENVGIENVKVIISPRDFRIDRRYPEIERIEWEEELYKLIENELNKITPFI